VYCKPLDSVPVSDQHVALGILLELGVQRGSLQHMLEVILLLLELWDSGQDNDTDSCFTSAPLIHLLRRFEEITGALHKTLEPNKLAEEVDIFYFNVLAKMSRNHNFKIRPKKTTCIHFFHFITDWNDNYSIEHYACAFIKQF